MFKKGNILTLADDHQYSVVDFFQEGSCSYVYLVDIDKNDNVIFGKLENDEIVELTDGNELEKVIRLVNEHLHFNQ